MKADNSDNVRKILVRAPNWIGDAVLCLPALESLKTVFPNAELTLVATLWVAPVFFYNPFVKRVMQYDKGGRHKGLAGRLRLVNEIRRDRFDMAVLFQNAFEAALIAFLSRIPVRAGYSTDSRGMLLTHHVELTSDIKNRHEVFYYLNIIDRVRQIFNSYSLEPGVNASKKTNPKIYLTDAEKEWARVFLKDTGTDERVLVGIAPGASYGLAKRWMPDRFRSVAERLVDVHRAKVILFGGKEDRSVCDEVLKGVAGLNLAGEFDLRKSIALMSRCDLFLTNDNGLMHIEASFGIPTVAIFGSTDPNLTAPVGVNIRIIKKDVACSPCFERECREGHYDCMKMITAEEVFNICSSLIKEKGRGRAVFEKV